MEYSGFFDGANQYGQDDFNRYYANMFENGVSIENGSMTLGVSAEMDNINIAPGFAIVKGFYFYNDSEKAIEVSRDLNYDRIDRIVIRLNLSDKKVSIEQKLGVAGSNPQVPALQRDNIIYELSLAQIRVPVAGNLIVTDERYKTELCGAIRPKNLTEFNDMIAGFQEEFDRWYENQQALGWRNIFIQEIEPTEAVTGSIWIQELV
jgi:hypothetical protein|nr:MAG TPA: Receptor Binding Protein [Caudoviricetes sp.]